MIYVHQFLFKSCQTICLWYLSVLLQLFWVFYLFLILVFLVLEVTGRRRMHIKKNIHYFAQIQGQLYCGNQEKNFHHNQFKATFRVLFSASSTRFICNPMGSRHKVGRMSPLLKDRDVYFVIRRRPKWKFNFSEKRQVTCFYFLPLDLSDYRFGGEQEE